MSDTFWRIYCLSNISWDIKVYISMHSKLRIRQQRSSSRVCPGLHEEPVLMPSSFSFLSVIHFGAFICIEMLSLCRGLSIFQDEHKFSEQLQMTDHWPCKQLFPLVIDETLLIRFDSETPKNSPAINECALIAFASVQALIANVKSNSQFYELISWDVGQICFEIIF